MKLRLKKRPNRVSTRRQSAIYFDWQEEVFKRDDFTCQHCGSKDNLHSHHIIPWDENEELRFVVSNGLTLCSSCHTRHHVPHKGFTQVPWNKGIKTGVGGPKGAILSEERRKKIGQANKQWVRTDEYRKKLSDAKTPENIEANKLRQKGRTWKLDPVTGKRVWIDK
jgi:hypothetical protein